MNLMHSCKQVAELLTRAYDEPLGIVDQLRLRMHLAMCDNCSNVAKQLGGVKTLTEDMFDGDFDAVDDGPGTARPSTKV
jgi:hypothetical protein